ncbi:UNVERIFIED_CONTAM: hypothetical protein FKN15_059820 [Acipenser sinensis]
MLREEKGTNIGSVGRRSAATKTSSPTRQLRLITVTALAVCSKRKRLSRRSPRKKGTPISPPRQEQLPAKFLSPVVATTEFSQPPTPVKWPLAQQPEAPEPAGHCPRLCPSATETEL